MSEPSIGNKSFGEKVKNYEMSKKSSHFINFGFLGILALNAINLWTIESRILFLILTPLSVIWGVAMLALATLSIVNTKRLNETRPERNNSKSNGLL